MTARWHIYPTRMLLITMSVLLVGLCKEVMAQASVEAPPVVPAAVNGAAPAQDAPQAEAPPEEKIVLDLKEGELSANTIKSLFFTPSEIQDIRMARHSFGKNLGARNDDFISQIAGATAFKKTERYFVYPQFFLNSLVYHSPTDWVIWVGEAAKTQKITPETPSVDVELHVVELAKNKVKFEWKPADMGKVMEVWETSPNEEIEVDMLQKTVRFTLRPNQTFSSYLMRVLEGRVLPVTVDSNAMAKSALSSIANEKAKEESVPADKAEGSNQGLGGLIGAYSKLGKDNPQSGANMGSAPDAPPPAAHPPIQPPAPEKQP